MKDLRLKVLACYQCGTPVRNICPYSITRNMSKAG
ncbi:hypothetical protein [Photobacterium leiognathi]